MVVDDRPVPEGELGACRGCGAQVWWRKTKNGRSAPFDANGDSHFSSCPKAGEFRRPR